MKVVCGKWELICQSGIHLSHHLLVMCFVLCIYVQIALNGYVAFDLLAHTVNKAVICIFPKFCDFDLPTEKNVH